MKEIRIPPRPVGLCVWLLFLTTIIVGLDCTTAKRFLCPNLPGCFRYKRSSRDSKPAFVIIKTEGVKPINICPNDPPVVLTCEIHGFKRRPRIRWYAGPHRVSNELYSNAEAKDSKGRTIFTSTFKFTHLPDVKTKKIECKASTSDQIASGHIKLYWPPPSLPKFRNSLDQQIKGTFNINEGEATNVLCHVKGGEPPVANVNVQCYKGLERLVFSASKGSMTQFTLNGTQHLNNSYCTCSAVHRTHCYGKISFLQIQVLSLKQSRGDPERIDTRPKFHLFFILLTLSGSLFVLVVLCAIVYTFFKRYRQRCGQITPEQTNNFFSCFNIIQTIRNRRNRDAHIYESIGTINDVTLINRYHRPYLMNQNERDKEPPEQNPLMDNPTSDADSGNYLQPAPATSFQRSQSAPVVYKIDKGTCEQLGEGVTNVKTYDDTYLTVL